MKTRIRNFTHRLLARVRTRATPAHSQAALRPGLEFAEVERRIAIYLRAMWAHDFTIKSAPRNYEARINIPASIELQVISLPAICYDLNLAETGGISALEIYRAAAAHAAAHIMFTRQHFAKDKLTPWQMAVISVIEDARVEALAIRRFPGLYQLWVRQHIATPAQNRTAGDYLNRLARALLDDNYADADPWVEQGRALFRNAASIESEQLSREIGLALAHTFAEKKIRPNPRTDRLSADYRDDNCYLWEAANFIAEKDLPPLIINPFKKTGPTKTLVEPSDSDQHNKRVLEHEPDDIEFTGKESAPFFYPEWNYRHQVETRDWVTLREIPAADGDLQVVDNIVARNKPLLSRMKTLLEAVRLDGVRRIRKLEEGDELDINAAIRAQIDLRQGIQPDTRIMMRSIRKTRGISALVLLDLSYSTNSKVKDKDYSVLQLTQEVCALFADAIASVGDTFAIHGFCSEGRRHVEYYRFKDFDQPYDEAARSRVAGMSGQRATRMGAAIRHATHLLNSQPSGKKLLMIITDGAPSDVDVHDGRYLRHDAKMAVENADRKGIHTYCVGLDPDADEYIARIFGARNYMVVDHISCLPEKMLMLYAELTR